MSRHKQQRSNMLTMPRGSTLVVSEEHKIVLERTSVTYWVIRFQLPAAQEEKSRFDRSLTCSLRLWNGAGPDKAAPMRWHLILGPHSKDEGSKRSFWFDSQEDAVRAGVEYIVTTDALTRLTGSRSS